MPVQAVPNEFLDEFPDLAGLATGGSAISPSLLSALFNGSSARPPKFLEKREHGVCSWVTALRPRSGWDGVHRPQRSPRCAVPHPVPGHILPAPAGMPPPPPSTLLLAQSVHEGPHKRTSRPPLTHELQTQVASLQGAPPNPMSIGFLLVLWITCLMCLAVLVFAVALVALSAGAALRFCRRATAPHRHAQ